jgi:acyl transferase domain-containing protein
VERFDPLFFNISPREAEMMDPQERLFLECVYEAIEDAGYARASLAAGEASRYPGSSASVGVYVGVMYEEYQLYGAQEQARGKPVALAGSPSSIANRVSYFFNFNGPSMAVDTMCSSSLTAIHLACESLKRGECQLAIAGGVNVSIPPNKYLCWARVASFPATAAAPASAQVATAMSLARAWALCYSNRWLQPSLTATRSTG